MSQDFDELVLAEMWDSHRQIDDVSRTDLARLLTAVRDLAKRHRTVYLTAADWTRAEGDLLTDIRRMLEDMPPEDIARCMALLAVEAAGRTVHIGMEIEL